MSMTGVKGERPDVVTREAIGAFKKNGVRNYLDARAIRQRPRFRQRDVEVRIKLARVHFDRARRIKNALGNFDEDISRAIDL
ncbi:hypothetical protein KKE45_00115 [Patescibacteria group bacterium]|nr:hypothetical protein [Patescibacteria group bacterium]